MTEDLFALDQEPASIQCPFCKGYAVKIASVPAFSLSWAPATYDVKDVWEGTDLEGGGEPNKFSYKSDKIQVDWGQDRKMGANTKVTPASGWEGAKAAFKSSAKDAAAKVAK
jgi:hypothetical protein